MWTLPPPPGFQGLDPNKPVPMYERHLPHWRQDDATYFVTFRLQDSLPQSKLQELEQLRVEWEKIQPPPRSHAALKLHAREVFERVERWLDQGMGSCVLRHGPCAGLMTAALHHFDDDRYELDCHVVMPNHVHLIVRPLHPDVQPLEKILESWKSYSARRINAALHQSGNLWQEESYDRIIRNEEHLWRVIQYIGSNPTKAGLAPTECSLWIRPQWADLGWTFAKNT